MKKKYLLFLTLISLAFSYTGYLYRISNYFVIGYYPSDASKGLAIGPVSGTSTDPTSDVGKFIFINQT